MGQLLGPNDVAMGKNEGRAFASPNNNPSRAITLEHSRLAVAKEHLQLVLREPFRLTPEPTPQPQGSDAAQAPEPTSAIASLAVTRACVRMSSRPPKSKSWRFLLNSPGTRAVTRLVGPRRFFADDFSECR